MALLAEAIVRIRYETGSAGRDLEKAIKSDPSIRRSGTDAGQTWAKSFATAAAKATPKISVGLAADVPKFIAELDAKLKAASERLKLKVPAEPDFKTPRVPRAPSVPSLPGEPSAPSAPSAPRAPSAPSSSDPVANALRDQIRRLSVSLGREVALKIPVTAETAELRAKLAAEIAELHRVTKLPVPVEAEDKAKFEAELSALAELVSHRVKVNLPVTVNDKEVPAKAKAIAEEAEKAGKINLPVNINTAFLTASLSRISTSLLRVGQGAGLAALGTALGSVAAEAVAVAGAIAPAAGAIALLPAAAFSAAAGLGTLLLASSGMAAAFKQASQAATSGGFSVAAAERQIAAAQRQSLQAQKDLDKARIDAARNLRDLSVQLSGAHLDEHQAILNVADAQKQLDAAIAGQNPDTIERARLAYDQAQQSLTEVRNRVNDLTQDQATAAKKGVEGSDLVQSALDRQRAAADALTAATEALTKRSGGLANAMAKLSPAAAAVVTTILGLRGSFDDLRKTVQESVFAGVAADIRSLAGTYLPVLKTGLSQVGGAFNDAWRQAAAFLGSARTVADISAGLHNTAIAGHELAGALGPILSALRDIGVVGSGFLPRIAAAVREVAQRFADFIARARDSGALQQFLDTALSTLDQLGRILVNVGGILSSVFSAGKDVGGGLLNTLEAVTGQLSVFFKSAEGQDSLKNFFATTKAVVDALLPPLVTVAKAIGTTVLPAVAEAIKALGPGLQIFASGLAAALGALAPAFGPISQIISGLISSLGPGLLAIAQGLATALSDLAPAAVPVGRALSDIAVAVAPLLPLIGQLLANALTEAATILSYLARILGPFIGLIADAFTGAMQALLPVIMQVAQTALPLIADAMRQVSTAFAPLVPVIIQMAQQFATALLPFVTQFEQIMAGKLLPTLLQIVPVLARGLLTALLQIAPSIPGIATAMGQMAVSVAQVLVALTPLLPVFVQLVGQILSLLLRSGAIQILFASMAAGLQFVATVVSGLVSVFSGFTSTLGQVASAIVGRFESMVSFVAGLPGRIGRAASGLWDGLWFSFRAAINNIIYAWNRLHFSVPSVTVFGAQFGGFSLYVPQIPYAAEGALVPATRGGRPVMLGDGGEDEWALGNTKLAVLLTQAAAAGASAAYAGSGDGMTLPRIEIPLIVNDKRIALAVREGETKLRRQ